MFNRLSVIVMCVLVTLGLLLGVVIMKSSSQPTRVQQQSTVPLSSATAGSRMGSVPTSAQMQSRFTSPLNLTALTKEADLIAVGLVTGAEDKGIVNTTVNGNPVQARRLITSLQVERVLKRSLDVPGGNPSLLSFDALMPTSGEIATGTFGVFFLRRTSPQHYSVVNPDHPYVFALAKTLAATSGSDLDRVVAEVIQVIESPDISINRRKQALSALEGVKTATATTALQRIAKGSNTELRLRAMTILLGNGDVSVLETAADTLLIPPPDAPPHELQNLSVAVREVKDSRAIPALARLLSSQDAEVRQSATRALRQIGGDAVIEPLSKALDDSDQMVRYSAVMGLAESTRQTDGAPSIDLYKQNEERYLNYWREKLKTK